MKNKVSTNVLRFFFIYLFAVATTIPNHQFQSAISVLVTELYFVCRSFFLETSSLTLEDAVLLHREPGSRTKKVRYAKCL